MTRLARSRAVQELARIVNDGIAQQHEIAVACDVAKSNVTRWLTEEQKPAAPARAILKRRFGIELSWWSEPEIVEAAAAPPAENLEKVEVLTLRQRAEKYQQIVDDVMRDANVKGASAAQRLRAVASATRVLQQIGKITGETKDLSESQIVKTQAWSRLCTTILKSLTPWPDAILAFGHALRELDLEGR